MSINAKQSLTGQINNPLALSGDVSIGTTYISAGEETGTPIVISATKIEGGYEISLTDTYDTETIQIMDGKDGAPGQPGEKGDQGEPGVSGVYYGSGEAPEECMVQVDPDGGAINLIEAPLAAEVGQTLVVKSVDENGVPTEWECVDVASGGSGVTQAQAQALDNMFKKCAFTEDVSAEYEAFKIAFGLGDTPVEPDEPVEPDVPEVTLTSISVTYTGGEVEAETSVNSLTGITVKATYSDGSTKNVTGYTLSGTIVEGSNTITVSYQGETTTFVVVGYVEPEEPDAPEENVLYSLTGDDFVQGGISFNQPQNNYVNGISTRCCHVGLDMHITEGKTIEVYVEANTTMKITLYALNQEAVDVFGKESITVSQTLTSGACVVATEWEDSGFQWTVPNNAVCLWVAVKKNTDSSINPNEITSVVIKEVVSEV